MTFSAVVSSQRPPPDVVCPVFCLNWAHKFFSLGCHPLDDVIRVGPPPAPLVTPLKMCKEISRLKLNELFTLDDGVSGTKGHSLKLVKFRCLWDYYTRVFF